MGEYILRQRRICTQMKGDIFNQVRCPSMLWEASSIMNYNSLQCRISRNNGTQLNRYGCTPSRGASLPAKTTSPSIPYCQWNVTWSNQRFNWSILRSCSWHVSVNIITIPYQCYWGWCSASWSINQWLYWTPNENISESLYKPITTYLLHRGWP